MGSNGILECKILAENAHRASALLRAPIVANSIEPCIGATGFMEAAVKEETT
jgi:hypothetical protein